MLDDCAAAFGATAMRWPAVALAVAPVHWRAGGRLPCAGSACCTACVRGALSPLVRWHTAFRQTGIRHGVVLWLRKGLWANGHCLLRISNWVLSYG